MRIKTKLILAFIAVALVGVLVGAIALTVGAHHTRQLARLQFYSDLRSDLMSRMIDQFDWAQKVESLFTENRERLTGQETAFGEFLFGSDDDRLAEAVAGDIGVTHVAEELDAFLVSARLRASRQAARSGAFSPIEYFDRQGAARAAETDRRIAERLAAVREPYLRMRRAISRIEKVWAMTHEGLQDDLRRLLIGHNEWAQHLSIEVLSGAPVRVETNPRKTTLGRWLPGQHSRDLQESWPAFAEIVEEIKKEKESLHASVDRLLAVRSPQERARIFMQETLPKIEDLRWQLTRAWSEEEQLVDRQERAREILTGEFLPALRTMQDRIRLALDDVNSTEAALRRRQTSAQTLQRRVILGCMAIGMLVAVLFGYAISRHIHTRIARSVTLADSVSVGILSFRLENMGSDEIGRLAGALNEMADGLEKKADLAGAIARGDLTRDVPLASREDALGTALHTMVRSLRSLIRQVGVSAGRVEQGSRELSNYSEALSQDAAHQAQALESFGRQIKDFSVQSTGSAESAGRATARAQQASENARHGSEQVEQMVQAMRNIGESNLSVSETIQIVDDIAEQTKLLALNATTEAIRAGTYGEGFAVVAQEIKNLANHTAEQARAISRLIRNAMEKTEIGVRVANEASVALQQIVGNVGEIGNIMNGIAQTSSSQANAVNLINEEISELQGITYRTASNAEKGAAAAEQLSHQATALRSTIDRFDAGAERIDAAPADSPEATAPSPEDALNGEPKQDGDDSERRNVDVAVGENAG